MRTLHRAHVIWLLPIALALSFGCAASQRVGGPAPQAEEAPRAERAPRAEEEPRAESAARIRPDLEVILLNGGGKPAINYYSHLDNLRRAVAILEADGVPRERITIFSADGMDAGLDLATRDGVTPPDFWLLPEAGVGRDLRAPIVFDDSRIAGHVLRPSSRDALRAWFESRGVALRAGETLLLYVTDHGKGNKDDPSNATISLWNETLSVEELRGMLAILDPAVRVVMVMSQCFSGSFANAIWIDGDSLEPRGNVCGYFSATADRRASGCYPEVSGKEKLGHSHRFFEGLERNASLAAVQRSVVLTDRTPNVPHASTDFFLEAVLRRAAEREGVDPDAFIDARLEAVWRDPDPWLDDLDRLERLAQSFGFSTPHSLAALSAVSESLPELSRKLRTFTRRWRRALEDLRTENLRLFVEAHPDWGPRLDRETLRATSIEAKKALARELLPELGEFTRESPARMQRLEDLRWKRDESKSARYRVEVRVGVVLRMRMLLTRIAGEYYVARTSFDATRSAYAELSVCEDLALGAVGRDDARLFRDVEPEPFGTLSEERALLEAVSPSWLGVRYRAPSDEERQRHALARGAIWVTDVVAESPAARAGIAPEDILLGPEGALFDEPHAVREFIMKSPVETPIRVAMLRDGERTDVVLRLSRYPLVIPELQQPATPRASQSDGKE